MNAAPDYLHTLRVGPFLQDVATIYTDIDEMSGQKVFTLARSPEGALYAGTQTGICRFHPVENRWIRVSEIGPAVSPTRFLVVGPQGVLWAGDGDQVHTSTPKGPRPSEAALPAETVALALEPSGSGPAYLLTPDIFHDIKRGRKVSLPAAAKGQVLTVLSDGTPIVATDQGLLRYTDGELDPVPPSSDSANIPGRLLDADVRALAAVSGGGLWIGTARGLNFYTEDAWLEITGNEGLPVAGIRCLAVSPEGDLWIGTDHGAALLRGGVWRYYAGKRWLPADVVHAIVVDSEGGAWVATEGGLSHIASVSMSFPQKAAHYEEITTVRHNRDGFVTSCRLTRAGDLSSHLFEASDNDGLWTSLYICAESFRYAVTQNPQARDLARKSLNALLDLVRVTGIPGFPARAIIRKGERVEQSDPGPNWYTSPIAPDTLYKNDTSSDEVDGHYLAWYIYSELVAEDAEKREIGAVCRAVTDHILEHHYTLVGPTGKATRWGVWAPEALNADPNWAAERGLNSLEILSHLKVAVHLCGDARFQAAYHSLIAEHHYALNTVRQKILPPEGENNHSDDELAACAYYPLLQLETDPLLRALYLLSLERTQSILRPERSPFHNMIYGACTGRPCDAEVAAAWLREAPWDLRDWTMTNSHRQDVILDRERGRFQELQLTEPLSPRERRIARWNSNPYAPDGGGEGRGEEDGTFWLLPYWMGRYHRIFAEMEP